MQYQKIIVIGASTGGVEAIKSLFRKVPEKMNASIFVVWHIAANSIGLLPDIINKLGTLPAASAIDNEPIQPGRIYVAPPDRHLILERDVMRVTNGPKENMVRPAIDPLFRSAACTYGSRVIGVILSGALDDGTAGLWAVKRRGGIAIVQDPSDAAVPSMPQSAIQAVSIDHCIAVSNMGELLVDLCDGKTAANIMRNHTHPNSGQGNTIELEVELAKGEHIEDQKILELGEPSKLACPECHGVLTALKEGDRTRFRCHTGHAFSADALLASLSTSIENTLWNAVRGLEESKFLCNYLGDRYSSKHESKLSETYFNRALEADVKAEDLRKLIYSTDNVRRDVLI